MPDRFYSSQPVAGERVMLDGPEAHHLLHVLRARPGHRVTLFDGSGAEWDAEVAVCGRRDVELRVGARQAVDRELPLVLVVGVSLPKGDRQKWLVEKLTELGVAELVPLVTERGVAQPTEAALARLERSVVEAAKQCRRNRLMRIAKPQPWDAWLSAGNGPTGGDPPLPECRRLLAHPGGASPGAIDFARLLPTHIAIGPEGGFTDAEAGAALAAGWQSVDLGPRILRVETAAVALSAVVALSARP